MTKMSDHIDNGKVSKYASTILSLGKGIIQIKSGIRVKLITIKNEL